MASGRARDALPRSIKLRKGINMATIWYFTKARETGQRVTITQEDFDYLLGVLPPIHAKGCYGLSEAVSHNAAGEPVLLWFSGRKDNYSCFQGTRAEAEAEYSKPEVSQTQEIQSAADAA